MDRLSSYAARESESEPAEDRKQTEEEAAAKLLEQLRVSKGTKSADNVDSETQQADGDQTNGDKIGETLKNNGHTPQSNEPEPASAAVDGEIEKTPAKKNRGIPDNVKLYEVFYEQVINLVNAQRLQIQDIIALLVSLTNLAL